jgi:hypothetical protein
VVDGRLGVPVGLLLVRVESARGIANHTVARTACGFGVQSLLSDGGFPRDKKKYCFYRCLYTGASLFYTGSIFYTGTGSVRRSLLLVHIRTALMGLPQFGGGKR